MSGMKMNEFMLMRPSADYYESIRPYPAIVKLVFRAVYYQVSDASLQATTFDTSSSFHEHQSCFSYQEHHSTLHSVEALPVAGFNKNKNLTVKHIYTVLICS